MNSIAERICGCAVLGYAGWMASDRIMQAIGTLERALSKLEERVEDIRSNDSHGALSPESAGQARAALQSLDQLIAELKVRTDG